MLNRNLQLTDQEYPIHLSMRRVMDSSSAGSLSNFAETNEARGDATGSLCRCISYVLKVVNNLKAV